MLGYIFLLNLFFIILSIYFLVTKKYKYWKKRNVPYLEPSFLCGNYGELLRLKKDIGHVSQEICKKFPNEPYIGTYYGTEPALIVQDPELIKHVMTKEFFYFHGREISKYTTCEKCTKVLFFTYGDYWKIIRQHLIPLFSSSKMKKMFSLIQTSSSILEETLSKEVSISQYIEAKRLAMRFILDCTMSCIFGIQTDLIVTNENKNPFAIVGNKIFSNKENRGRKLVVRSMWPKLFYGLRFQLFEPELLTFFMQMLKEVFQNREKFQVARHDFVDFLFSWKDKGELLGNSIDPKKNSKISLDVNNDVLAEQCFQLFAASFETSSSAVSYGLYELAKNKYAQKKLIKEIDKYFEMTGGKMEYDCIENLPYLKACFDETTRLYPVLGVITREVMENYTLPTGLHLDKGLRIHIPVYHLHHDPKYFPEPEKFRPERFLRTEKQKVTPYTFLPFGEGPRICIGIPFAKMVVMAAFMTILKNYEVDLAEGMSTKLDFVPGAIVTQAANDINLIFTKRAKS